MKRLSLGAAQAVLTTLAVVSLVGFVVWVLGANVLGIALLGDLPRSLQPTQANAGAPFERVLVDGRAALASVVLANGELDFPRSGAVVPGAAEFSGGDLGLSFYGATRAQQLSWAGARALPLLGAAVVWWLLARVVGAVRRHEGFAVGTVTRLRVVGLLLVVGAPVVELARWGVGRWLVSTSEAADLVTLPPPTWSPWPFAAGLTVLLLSVAWAENGRMRRDLEGLV